MRLRGLAAHLPALGEPFLIQAGEPEEAVLALHRRFGGAPSDEKKSSISNS